MAPMMIRAYQSDLEAAGHRRVPGKEPTLDCGPLCEAMSTTDRKTTVNASAARLPSVTHFAPWRQKCSACLSVRTSEPLMRPCALQPPSLD